MSAARSIVNSSLTQCTNHTHNNMHITQLDDNDEEEER